MHKEVTLCEAVLRMTDGHLRSYVPHALRVRPSIVRNVSCMQLGLGTLAVVDVRLKTLGAAWRYLEVRVGRVPPQMSRSISAGRRFNEGHELIALLVGAVVGLACAYCQCSLDSCEAPPPSTRLRSSPLWHAVQNLQRLSLVSVWVRRFVVRRGQPRELPGRSELLRRRLPNARQHIVRQRTFARAVAPAPATGTRHWVSVACTIGAVEMSKPGKHRRHHPPTSAPTDATTPALTSA